MERRTEKFWRTRLENMKANGDSEKVAKAWIKRFLANNTDRPALDIPLSKLVLDDVYNDIPIPRVDDDGKDPDVQTQIDDLKLKVGALKQKRELGDLQKLAVELDEDVCEDIPIPPKEVRDARAKSGMAGGQKETLPPRQKAK